MKLVTAAVLGILALSPSLAYAACSAAYPVGNAADSVVSFLASGTNLPFVGPTTFQAVEAGTLTYDSGSNTLQLCNGTAWTAIATSSSAGSSGTAGYVQISAGSGAFTSDSTAGGELFWDSTNHRLGIGTSAPAAVLDVSTTDRVRLINGVDYINLYPSLSGDPTLQLFNSGQIDLRLIGTGGGLSIGGPSVFATLTPSVSWFSTLLQSSILTALDATNPYVRIWKSGVQYFDFNAGIAGRLDLLNTSATKLISFLSTGNVGIGTTTPTNLLSLGGDAARTIWMERSATSAATGNSLTLQAGGTKSGNTDQNGGDLVLSSGTATGTGSSNITFKTAPAGTTGTTDRAPATAMTILGNGSVGIGTASPSFPLHIRKDLNGGAYAYLENATAGTLAAAAQVFRNDQGAAADGSIGVFSSLRTTYGALTANSFGMYTPNTAGMFFMVDGAGSIRFATGSNAERMRIDSNGNVSIGTTSAISNSRLTVEFNATGGGPAGLELNETSVAGSGGYFTRFRANGTTIGSIGYSGTSAVVYNTTSDRRLKENIQPSSFGLQTLMRIEVDDFNFIADRDKRRVQGFIAQQLQDIYPVAVTVGGDDPSSQPWAVDYGRISPLLVKSIQELKAANDNLRAEQAAEIKTLRDEFHAYKAAHP